jgi:hypothetical protein
MNKNQTMRASIIFALLGVLLVLPILVGGTGSTLFTVLFWTLAIVLAATLIFAYANRRKHF